MNALSCYTGNITDIHRHFQNMSNALTENDKYFTAVELGGIHVPVLPNQTFGDLKI